MTGITITKRDNKAEVTLDEETLVAFQAALRGPCVTADDDTYDAAQLIWNKSADKRPALIGFKTDEIRRVISVGK